MKRFLRSKLVFTIAAFLMIVAVVAIPLSSPRSAFAAFSLDPAFGNGGKVITSFGHDAYAGSIALQTDGKTVVGGAASNGSHYNCTLARYNTGGSLDVSFGSNGTVTQDFGKNCAMYSNSLIIQSDGKIVAAEEPYSPGYFWRLVRYNSDGSIDTTFGNNGIVATAMISSDYDIPYAITIQSTDQKIIVVGWTATSNDGNESLAVVRYNPDGSLDQTFGNGGEVITTIAGSSFIRGKAVTLQQDGKIVVYGDLTYGGSNTLYVTRFNSDGSFDTTFGNNGYVTDQSMNNPGATAVTLQSDGKIVVTGAFNDSGTTRSFVIRYNSDGTHDAGFGSGGYVLNPLASIDSADSATSLIIQSDSKIIFGGNAIIGSNSDFVLGRLNIDGSQDTNFGTNGAIVTPMGTGGSSIVLSLAHQTDGKVLAAGLASNGSYDDWALARYADITNTDTPPSINSISNTTINEGATYSVNGSFTDPDSTSWTATVDYGDSSGASSLTLFGTNFSLSHTYKDNDALC